MKQQEIMKSLSKWGKFFEVTEVIGTYRGYRKSENGEIQEVNIEILDLGDTHQKQRYVVQAKPLNSKLEDIIATGNPEESIEIAICTTHWNKLD